ncbi:Leucine-rich repeat-containing protein 15 [Halotydeus destructor]|nr:Leucine-rich repeat-containing protein 15 [Halotydeus destructor]
MSISAKCAIFLPVTLLILVTSGQSSCSSSSTTARPPGLTGSRPSRSVVHCPPSCSCDVHQGRKRVQCVGGGLKEIPVSLMDKQTQVLIVSGPKEKPNSLTIGRIFMDFSLLQEVVITNSQLPAIGDSTFWPGARMGKLDLSNNRIAVLIDQDFNGLTNLVQLDLSDNRLTGLTSAIFHHCPNLTKLSLAANKLTKLVPRLFFRLDKLDHLDMGGNPLTEIHTDDIKDARALRTLRLRGCKLERLHSLIYQSLSRLEELDIRDNLFSSLASGEFEYLRNLKVLLLDGNRLTTLVDNTFFGHALEDLGLSANLLVKLDTCTFCNATVKRLDMSRNQVQHFQERLMDPLKDSLIALVVAENGQLADGPRSVLNLVKPLRRLKVLSVASTNLDDSIVDYLFEAQANTLQDLRMSGNKLVNISSKWFLPLKVLTELDLSANQMYGLSAQVLKAFDNMKTLKQIYLQDNPWSCHRCHILPLLDWIASDPVAYAGVCRADQGFCVKCASPSDLRGRDLSRVNEIQLEWCADPSVQLRLTTSEPKMGLVLAMLIIVSLVIVIIAVVFMYRKRKGTYYTHEDERFTDKTIFTVEDHKAICRSSSCCCSLPDCKCPVPDYRLICPECRCQGPSCTCRMPTCFSAMNPSKLYHSPPFSPGMLTPPLSPESIDNSLTDTDASRPGMPSPT